MSLSITYVSISNGQFSQEFSINQDDLTMQVLAIKDQSQYASGIAATENFIECAFRETDNGNVVHSLFLALHQNEVLGFLELRTTFDVSEIDFIGVDLAFRRLGIGKHLVSNAAQHAIKSKSAKVLLEVGETNAAAIALYKELLFEPISTRKNYYRDGENAIIMERAISAASVQN